MEKGQGTAGGKAAACRHKIALLVPEGDKSGSLETDRILISVHGCSPIEGLPGIFQALLLQVPHLNLS